MCTIRVLKKVGYEQNVFLQVPEMGAYLLCTPRDDAYALMLAVYSMILILLMCMSAIRNTSRRWMLSSKKRF